MSSRLKTLFVLHLMLLMYSISDILSKCAGFAEFPSWQFVMLYAGVIVILGIYALGWQQILARLPLTTAYSNRAVVVVWGIIWGVLFFGEAVTWQKLLGAAMIIAGVVLFSRADSEDLSTDAIAIEDAAEGIEGIADAVDRRKRGEGSSKSHSIDIGETTESLLNMHPEAGSITEARASAPREGGGMR